MLIFYCKMPSGLIFGVAIPLCKRTQYGPLEESGGPWQKTTIISKKGVHTVQCRLKRIFFIIYILSAPSTFALEALVRTLPFTGEVFHYDKLNGNVKDYFTVTASDCTMQNNPQRHQKHNPWIITQN